MIEKLFLSLMLIELAFSAGDNEANLCPTGSHLQRNFTSGAPMSCDKLKANTCLPPFTCESNLNSNSTSGYCCVKDSSKAQGCPPGQAAYVNGTTKRVQLCKMWDNQACPDSFYCQYSDINSQFQCCRLDAGCSNEGSSEIDPKTGRTRTCDSTADCGPKHQCELSSTLKRKICCRPLVKEAAKPSFASIPTVKAAPPSGGNKTKLYDTNDKPTCLDWLADCAEIAAKGQCNEGDGHWVSCCNSCKRSLSTEPESLCYDRLQNCEEFKSATEGYCTHPSWSFDSQMNCYKTCYC